ncbi:hypothetical protein Ocin01_19027 [Orchesella cincta]|uniref:Uncharacterized protein n=1 Tax=Orchesella cincta TaxID=48709 RepID=A0A1D2M3V4_ORCCI|nr:hypothetical protein Ocin01_19027 [Orchesella cincta]
MLRMPYGPYGTPDKQTLKFKISAKGPSNRGMTLVSFL